MGLNINAHANIFQLHTSVTCIKKITKNTENFYLQCFRQTLRNELISRARSTGIFGTIS